MFKKYILNIIVFFFFILCFKTELASTDTNMTSSSSSDVDCNNQDRARKSSSGIS